MCGITHVRCFASRVESRYRWVQIIEIGLWAYQSQASLGRFTARVGPTQPAFPATACKPCSMRSPISKVKSKIQAFRASGISHPRYQCRSHLLASSNCGWGTRHINLFCLAWAGNLEIDAHAVLAISLSREASEPPLPQQRKRRCSVANGACVESSMRRLVYFYKYCTVQYPVGLRPVNAKVATETKAESKSCCSGD
ncbi:hypothetical protein NA56DRAFT_189881 [Hyaloscypha hepaticicola]|uniref:Uncharacterized protein n=1 Tax=Hyaloscypha hepaticicola TaxID=2082293 RepID=A0A2J6Q0Q0_9HELO|nr:hypothetical protein NA56DRAFT_189881 [Hyaloscypha hepaticicola]